MLRSLFLKLTFIFIMMSASSYSYSANLWAIQGLALEVTPQLACEAGLGSKVNATLYTLEGITQASSSQYICNYVGHFSYGDSPNNNFSAYLNIAECPSPYTEDSSGNCVEATCQAGEQLAPQFTAYPIQQASFVHGDCEVKVTSCGDTQEVITDGVSTQFAFCNFELTGTSKTDSNYENLPPPECFGQCAELPDNTCKANQSSGTFNGQFVCVDNSTGEFADTTPRVQEQKETTKTTQDNGDGTSTTTTTTTTTTNNNTTSTSTTQTITDNATGETVSESTLTESDQPEESDSDFGNYAVTDKAGLYEKTDKTFGSVIDDFQQRISLSNLGGSISTFFDLSIGGSCPVWTLPAVWVFPAIPIDMQCSTAMTQVWPFISAVMVLVMGFYAWRVAIDG